MSAPPRIAMQLLRLFSRGDQRDEVEGDLAEGYEGWVQAVGPLRARLRVWREVLLFLAWRCVSRLKRRERTPVPSRSVPRLARTRREAGAYLSDFRQDLGYACRRALRTPWASVAVILVVGLGVGGNATIFTIVDAVLLRPPALIFHPRELVGLYSDYDEFGYDDFLFYREHGGAFQDVLAYSGLPGTRGRTSKSGGEVAVGRGNDPVQAQAWIVSTNFFRVLGVPLTAGSGFTGKVGESQTTAPEVVLSHGFWVRHFGGDDRATRAPLVVNGVPFRVVGVTPEAFRGLNPTDGLPDLFIPIMAAQAIIPDFDEGLGRYSPSGEPQGGRFLRLVGRLKPGMRWDAALAEIALLQRQWEREFTPWAQAVYGRTYQVRIRREFSLTRSEARQMKRMLSFLSFVVGSVFLIACTNLAMLFFARAAGREREMGIRASLGAGRARLIRQLLTESMILASLGGGIGVVIAFTATTAASRMLPTSIVFDLTPNGAVILFALFLATLSALLFGSAPAWSLSRVDVGKALNRPGQARSSHLVRGGLVAVQVALSIVLLIVGGLFARSLYQARSVPLGFETENRLLMSVLLENHGYAEKDGQAFLTEALTRIRGVPGVSGVTVANRMPFQPRNDWEFVVPGTEYSEAGLYAGLNMVGPEFFKVMGIPIVAGRPVGEGDGPGSARSVVVNRLFGDRMWPGQTPVGKTLTFPTEGEWTVVGVAENSVYWQLGEDPLPFVYFPLRQLYTGRMTFHVETISSPIGAARAVEQALRSIDPHIAIATSTVGARLDGQLAGFRTWTVFVAVFSTVAFLLAMVGLYGVQSFLVARRTREFGIRFALGARPGSVVVRVLGGGLTMAGIGVVAGVGSALAGLRLVQSFLFGVSLYDPLVYALACAGLLGAAVLASFLPAAKASRISPSAALAQE